MTMVQERIDRIYHWAWAHTRSMFAAFIVVFAVLGGAATYAIAGPPAEVVGVEQSFIVESSRDIDGMPKAVAERRDGSRVFINGVYTEGEPVSIPLAADGSVVSYTKTEYWFYFVVFAALAGLAGLIPAMFAHMHLDDSERVRRVNRANWMAGVR